MTKAKRGRASKTSRKTLGIASRLALIAPCVLLACTSVKPLPGSTEVKAWQKKFSALDCWNPRRLYDMPSTEPLLFAMTRICNRVPFKRESYHGYQTLVTIDARTDEVRAIPMRSVYGGGVHFTETHDVIWYSSGNTGEAGKTQRYVEAFKLAKGEMQEQSMGRIAIPFVGGTGVGFLKGDGCHLISVSNFRREPNDPRLSQFIVVKDTAPFSPERRLEDVGRGLFWDPVRKYFVVQKEPSRDLGVRGKAPLSRFGIDCSGNSVAIESKLATRLDSIWDENARYEVAANGNLMVKSRVRGESSQEEISIFFGDQVRRIKEPGSMPLGCPDVCEPWYLPIAPVAWSKSGDYFMIDFGISDVRVYRLADMRIVKGWTMKDSGDFPAHGFINDHTAYQFNDHSRLSLQQWTD